MGEKVQELRSIIGRYKKDRDREGVKNSIGNGELIELICMTYRYELRRELLMEGRGIMGRGE